MAKSYYSTVLDRSAEEVWDVIRDFGNYAWAGVTGETIIEWWATFDWSPDERERWTGYFENEGFAVWLRSLREHLAGIGRGGEI